MFRELELIQLIRNRFSRNKKRVGIGDDAVVLNNGIVISTDSFVDGVHFDLRYFTMSSLGYHCLTASLSDLAAMSARPICVLISLMLTRNINKNGINELYKGFNEVCQKYDAEILGGDIVSSPTFSLTITVVGFTKNPLLRSNARIGQFLYVTNFLGLAEVGRFVLHEGLKKREFPVSIKKHLYPEPRFNEAKFIKTRASACIDISDGLSTDANHIAEESEVKLIIEKEKIPLHPEVIKFCQQKKTDPIKFILAAGEDFELLFTTSKLLRSKNLHLHQIGRVEEGRGLYLSSGEKIRQINTSGYEHYKI